MVHCSAGIGRSGTFALVDTCLVLVRIRDVGGATRGYEHEQKMMTDILEGNNEGNHQRALALALARYACDRITGLLRGPKFKAHSGIELRKRSLVPRANR